MLNVRLLIITSFFCPTMEKVWWLSRRQAKNERCLKVYCPEREGRHARLRGKSSSPFKALLLVSVSMLAKSKLLVKHTMCITFQFYGLTRY